MLKRLLSLPSPAAFFSSPAPRHSPTTRKIRTKATSPSSAWSRSPSDTPDFLLEPSYISRQLLYLAGPLQAAPKKAAAKNDAKVDVLGKHRDSKTGKLYVRYRYTGTFVLDNGLQDVVKIRLPLNLDEIWERSSDNCFSWGDNIGWPTFGLR